MQPFHIERSSNVVGKLRRKLWLLVYRLKTVVCGLHFEECRPSWSPFSTLNSSTIACRGERKQARTVEGLGKNRSQRSTDTGFLPWRGERDMNGDPKKGRLSACGTCAHGGEQRRSHTHDNLEEVWSFQKSCRARTQTFTELTPTIRVTSM